MNERHDLSNSGHPSRPPPTIGDARSHGERESEKRKLDLLYQLLEPIAGTLSHPGLSDLHRNPNGTIIATFVDGTARQLDAIIRDHEAMQIISAVAALLGREISASNPTLTGTLPDGSRFTAEIMPVAHPGPQFDIRKHTLKELSLNDYVRAGTLTAATAGALRKCIADHRNILVAGATRSGKTTFANALLAELAGMSGPEERIAIIEDASELKCSAKNYFSWQIDPASGNTMMALIAQAMRSSPRRICIGELRGPEALALVQAWGTDHDGGLTTIHAGSVKGALARLEDLYAQSGQTPNKYRIASAVHVVIVIEQTPAGRRIREVKRVVDATDRDYRYEDL